jgi:hypothetical protein
MTPQQSLFSAANLASTVLIPPAPKLFPHNDWPYPGMTPKASAQASLSSTEQYHEMLAAVIKTKGGARLTAKEVLASMPADWRDVCGQYAHGNIANWAAEKHGVESNYVAHDDGGFHFEYMAKGGTQ